MASLGITSRLWVITKREYLERVRSKWFVVATVFGPLFIGALLFLPPWPAARSTPSEIASRVLILDATGGSEIGKRIAVELNGGIGGDTSHALAREVAPHALAQAESAATAAALRGEVSGYLLLDADAIATARARYTGTNASALADMEAIRRALRRAVMTERLERAGVDPFQASTLTGLQVRLDAQRLTSRGRSSSGRVSLVFALSIAIMLYFSIFMYGQNVLRGVMEEKQTRVAEVVMSSVPAARLLDGKVLGVGAVGLTQIAIWAAAAALLLRVRGPVLSWLRIPSAPLGLPDISPGMALTLVLFFVLGYIFYAAIFAGIGAIVSSEMEAQQAQLPVVLMLAGSIAFVQTILMRPDGGLATTLSWLPFSAPIVMPLRLSVIQVPMWQVAAALGSLVVGCYAVVWMAARVYRVGLLMYGKRPTFREIGRWLRHAH